MISRSSQCFLFIEREINISTLSIACFHVEVLEVLNSLSLIDQESADHDSTGVNHRVVWSTFTIENWGVEYNTTWLFTDILVYIITSALLDIEIVDIGICNDLANRLHGELAIVITKLTELAIS